MNPDLRLGVLAGLSAYLLWGFLPVYFKLLGHVTPADMLANRIVWSVPTGLAFLALASRWADLAEAFKPARLRWLVLSGMMIGSNWFLYIWAVGEGRVMEASLGYYMNPLVSVLLGLVFLSERLRALQWLAVGLAGIGVAFMTPAFGRVPWIALFLCMSFALYGLIRKQVPVDGRAGFVVEAAVLFPLAAIWLLVQAKTPGGSPFGANGFDLAGLVAAGPVTAIPLILFAVAAKRLKLSTIGMMQYIAPTLQFLVALLYGEPFTRAHGLAFSFIWIALIVFTLDSVLGNRRARRLARAAQLS